MFIATLGRQGMLVTRRLLASRSIDSHIKAHRSVKLNVGSQGNLIPGWLNADLYPYRGHIYMDATKPWPMPANSCDAILCEHMIEHVPKKAGAFVLAQAYQALKPGCSIRVVTPNSVSFAAMLTDEKSATTVKYRDFIRTRITGASVNDVVNNIFYGHGHRYIYNKDELTQAMRVAGFVDLQESEPGTPDNAAFVGAEGHPKLVGHDINAIEAMAFEARKPA